MIDILNSEIGTSKIKKIKSRMFIFADYSVTEEYQDFMDKILNDNRYQLIEQKENFDLQGTLTLVVTYSVIEDDNNE